MDKWREIENFAKYYSSSVSINHRRSVTKAWRLTPNFLLILYNSTSLYKNCLLYTIIKE